MTPNIETARRQLADVDISAQVAAIGDVSEQRQHIALAIEEGRERISQLAVEIRNATSEASVDATAAADSLLAGEAPDGIDIDALKAAQTAVKVGMDDLRKRDDALAEKLRREQSAATAVLAGAVEPLVAEVAQMAQEAAQALARTYAAAQAVEQATSSGEAGRMADRLKKIVDKLVVEHLHPVGPVPVPDEIASALREAEGSIKALRHTLPSEVRVF